MGDGGKRNKLVRRRAGILGARNGPYEIQPSFVPSCFILVIGCIQAKADFAEDEGADELGSGVKGFVPMDRLAEEAEDWTALPLLQDEEE